MGLNGRSSRTWGLDFFKANIDNCWWLFINSNSTYANLINWVIDILTMQVDIILVGLQYIDKKWSCQPDLVDAQNTEYLA